MYVVILTPVLNAWPSKPKAIWKTAAPDAGGKPHPFLDAILWLPGPALAGTFCATEWGSATLTCLSHATPILLSLGLFFFFFPVGAFKALPPFPASAEEAGVSGCLAVK